MYLIMYLFILFFVTKMNAFLQVVFFCVYNNPPEYNFDCTLYSNVN